MVKQIYEVEIAPEKFAQLYLDKKLGLKLKELIKKAGDRYFGDGKTARKTFGYTLEKDAKALERLKKRA